ncbi:hydroxymethylglutaryl-CoA lyase [beta proteobacterium MWH-UniP1]
MPEVLISEVGPRDGLQSIARTMATQDKCAWIKSLADAGLREIEVASFVPAKLLPQMADAAQVVAYAKGLPDLLVTALVPNVKGAAAAFASGVDKITIPFSASEAHSLSNVRKTHAQMLDEVAAILALRQDQYPHVQIETSLSTAFGCSIAGPVSEDTVSRLASQLVELGVEEIGLADTTGYANPAQVRRLFERLRAEIGERCTSAHLHNTRGLGLANALAAYQAGIRIFDSSMGGIGGCPFAPGASGNVVTEDLVFMFESMGISTGVDLEKLMLARDVFARGLPDEPTYGMLPAAGLPKGFAHAG